jgi:hypothetical protein
VRGRIDQGAVAASADCKSEEKMTPPKGGRTASLIVLENAERAKCS